MNPSPQDFFNLVCNNSFKRISEIIQDGFSGMYFVLRLLSDAKEKLLAGDISEQFGVTTARTAVILATLEKKGLIEKNKSEEDGRKTFVEITNLGTQIIEKRKAEILEKIGFFLNKLSDDEKSNFYSILQKLLTT